MDEAKKPGPEAKPAPKAAPVARDCFEWSKAKSAELDAKYENQWTSIVTKPPVAPGWKTPGVAGGTGMLDVFTWVFNKWAEPVAGTEGREYRLLDAGASLTESQFMDGVAAAMAVTFK